VKRVLTKNIGQNYKVLETCGQVDLSDVFITKIEDRFYTTVIPGIKTTGSWNFNLMLEGYEANIGITNHTDMTMGIDTNGRIWLCNKSAPDAQSLRNSLQGKPVTYELANPRTYLITEVSNA